jgi:hypothetical protein
MGGGGLIRQLAARFVSLPPDASACRQIRQLAARFVPLPPIYLLATPFDLVLFRGRRRRSVGGRLGPSGKAARGHAAAALLRRRGLDPKNQ